MTEKVIILGSTGSIGTQALEVAEHLNLEVTAIAAGKNIKLAEQQIRRFRPKICAICDENAAHELSVMVADTPTKIISGESSASEAAAFDSGDTVLNAVSGFSGLFPALSAVRAGKKLAIANKESLVAAGPILKREIEKNGVTMIPVDSEHCAVHQCIDGKDKSEISKLIITASGGAFFGRSRCELEKATLAEACTHPNWSMGRKITIDSASLANKGLELIEAVRLFDIPEDRIDVVVHRESIIHSMAEFCDGSVLAQMAVPDMRLCIQYAMTYPAKLCGKTPSLNLAKIGKLSFFDVDSDAFPTVELARRAIRMGGVHPCIFNAANEAAVKLFCDGKIAFTDIFLAISSSLDAFAPVADADIKSIDDIIRADSLARSFVADTFGRG